MIDALERAAATNPADMAALREAVAGCLTTPTVTYDTVQGDITFDANGDTSQLIVSIYSFDPAAKHWKFETQVDYATAAVDTRDTRPGIAADPRPHRIRHQQDQPPRDVGQLEGATRDDRRRRAFETAEPLPSDRRSSPSRRSSATSSSSRSC